MDNYTNNKKQYNFVVHDLINQTHSLNLFLEQKLSQLERLTIDEMILIKNELMIVQQMIQQEFTTINDDPELPLESDLASIYKLVTNLVHSYLPDDTIINHADLDMGSHSYFINYACLSRVVTNLIKNISEAQGDKVTISFSIKHNYLLIHFCNGFTVPTVDNSSTGKGYGISSTKELLKNIKGSYSSFIDQKEKVWHTFISLPCKWQEQIKKIA